VAGLKEPPIERTGQGYLGAIARGQIVHDVLEGLQEDADVDALLETAIGKWDDSAAPPDSAMGRDLREMLGQEIRLVSEHPDYRNVAENPTRRREMPFVHLAGADRHLQGLFDLAACESDGLVLLDVKTAQGDVAHAAEVASRYDLQRSAYVTAAESIGGMPVSRFAFQFSRAEAQISTPVGPAEREQARQQVEEVFAAIEAGDAGLTAYPKECGYCGFKRAGWCPGVNDKAE
jgi:ATP-dependent exoDNAse (exonuclease V) beta subunit